MKAEVNTIILVIVAFLVCALILFLIISKIAEPSVKVHGNQQAYAIAKTLASDINGLSVADEGEITKSLKLEWDIVVSCLNEPCQIKVSYGDKGSDNVGIVNIFGDVDEFSENSIKNFKIIKEAGEKVRIENLGDVA